MKVIDLYKDNFDKIVETIVFSEVKDGFVGYIIKRETIIFDN